MFSFTVYEGALPNRGFCYALTEVDGKRGASEIGSGLMKYITNKVPEHVEHLIFYSDTCGGQNRNVHISALFWLLKINSWRVDIHTWRWTACIGLSNTAKSIWTCSAYKAG